MSSDRPTSTRRRFLAGVGGGMAGLAGCAGIETPWGEPEPDFDYGTLSALADREPPRIADPISVGLPTDLTDAYLSRAVELLESVPADPEVPNEMVAARLAEERERVASHLDAPIEGTTTFDRLGSARYRLGNAADLDAAYRAARGAFDLDSVDRDMDRLRNELHSFLRSWDYRGPGPLEALVFHRKLEDVLAEARRATKLREPLPGDPTHAPFTVGAVVGDITRGRAAVESARRLRTQFIEGLDPPPAFRRPIIARAYQIDRLYRESGHQLRRYFEDHGRRDIEGAGSPAEYLFREVEIRSQRARDTIVEARDSDHFAHAVLGGGRLFSIHTVSRRAIELVRDEAFPAPDSAGTVVNEYETAVSTLESTRSSQPEMLTPLLAWQARDTLDNGLYRLDDSGQNARDVYRAMAMFRLARLYAEAVPVAARTVASWFGM